MPPNCKFLLLLGLFTRRAYQKGGVIVSLLVLSEKAICSRIHIQQLTSRPLSCNVVVDQESYLAASSWQQRAHA